MATFNPQPSSTRLTRFAFFCVERAATGFQRLTNSLSPATLLWGAVIVLHLALFARRMALGQWSDPASMARAALCLVAVSYCAVKLRGMTLAIDSSPRRARAFIAVLLIGHAFIIEPAHQSSLLAPFDAEPSVLMIAVAPVMAGLGLLLIGSARILRSSYRPVCLIQRPRQRAALAPFALRRHLPLIYHRPPPYR